MSTKDIQEWCKENDILEWCKENDILYSEDLGVCLYYSLLFEEEVHESDLEYAYATYQIKLNLTDDNGTVDWNEWLERARALATNWGTDR